MSAREFDSADVAGRNREMAEGKVDNREGILGLIALISLAIPALLIRNLLPDLNPLILAALGVAVYSAYLGVMFMALARQAEGEQSQLETAQVTAKQE